MEVSVRLMKLKDLLIGLIPMGSFLLTAYLVFKLLHCFKNYIMKLELFNRYLPHKLTVRVDYQRDYVGREFDQVIGIHQWDTRGALVCLN
jgi:hypothetical protein